MQTLILAVVTLLCAAPIASAQQSVVERYRGNYPTPMSAEQKVDLLRHVAADVHGGLLVKRDGTNCGGYSCDSICFSDVTLFDVLTDQDGAAIPAWSPTTNPRGYRCELVTATPPVIPSPLPSPPVIPSLPPNLELASVLNRLDAIYQQNERIYADLTNQHHDQTATLKAAIDSPAWYEKVFGNKAVQLAIVGLGTWAATHQVMR
jgi:hypothetical protein